MKVLNRQSAPHLVEYMRAHNNINAAPGVPATTITSGSFMSEGRRNADLASLAGTLRHRWGLDGKELHDALSALNGQAERPLPEGEVARIARSVGSYEVSERPAGDEIALSRQIADRLKVDFRIVGKTWMQWQSPRWVPDNSGAGVQEAIKDILAEYTNIARANGDGESVKGFGTARKVGSMLKLVSSDVALQAAGQDFDADANLLNLCNGVMRLDTGELLPHDPSFMLTKLVPVNFDPQATCPAFDGFLRHVQPDEEVRAFLARLFGYALLGNPVEQRFAIFHGVGRNGKSTLVSAILAVLGDYARTAEPSTFIKQKGERIRTDLARLAGARLVSTSELAIGEILDGALIKRMTGGEKITARRLYEGETEYKPQFTPIMTTNALPVIDGGDSALARRLLLVPFDVVVGADDQDMQLDGKLQAEGAGILRWMLEGLRDYQRRRLAVPDAITAAVDRYVKGADLIQEFLDEYYLPDPTGKIAAGELVNLYRAWCIGQNIKALSAPTLKAELEKRGITSGRVKTMRYYSGLAPLPSGGRQTLRLVTEG